MDRLTRIKGWNIQPHEHTRHSKDTLINLLLSAISAFIW